MADPTIRLAYVLSYRAPWYVRSTSILEALRSLPGVAVTEIVNRREGPSRYLETLRGLRCARPASTDLYVVGFRGHEIFPAVRAWARGTPVVLDSLVSPSAALTGDGKAGSGGELLGRLLRPVERHIVRSADAIIVDSTGHADYLCEEFGVEPTALHVVPIGAAEGPRRRPAGPDRPLRLLFYGTFLPLHGVGVVTDALEAVAHLDLRIRIVGGSGTQLRHPGACHDRWVPFRELIAEVLPDTDLMLGGPFGPTDQASRVVTGKTVQALAASVPTVVGRSPETERAGFVDRENCLTVPRDDPHGLADAIAWADSHRDDLERIGRNGRTLYEARFSTAALARALDPLVRTLT